MHTAGRIQRDPYSDLFERPGSEAFGILFNAEGYFMVSQSYINDEGKQAQRRHAAEIMDSHTEEYIDAVVPYTAMTYVDRFLSQHDDFPDGDLWLFVVCCLTIAWKLRHKSFVLSSFLSARKIWFSPDDVLQMELQICKGLEWRMQTLTPFFFLDFFIKILDLPPDWAAPRHPVCDLIIRAQCDIAFAEFRPSVMAASAMITVSSRFFPGQKHDLLRRKILSEVEPFMLLTDMILDCINRLTRLADRNRFTNINTLERPPAEPRAPAPEQTSGSVESNQTQPPGTNFEPERRETGRPDPSEALPETDGPMPIRRPGKEPATTSEHTRQASTDLFFYDDLDVTDSNDIILPASHYEEVERVQRIMSESIRQALSRTRTRAADTNEIQPEEPMPSRRPGKEPITSEIQATEDDINQGWRELMEEAKENTQLESKYEPVDVEVGRNESLEEEERRDGPQHPCVMIAQMLNDCCTMQKLADCCTKTRTFFRNVKDRMCNFLP